MEDGFIYTWSYSVGPLSQSYTLETKDSNTILFEQTLGTTLVVGILSRNGPWYVGKLSTERGFRVRLAHGMAIFNTRSSDDEDWGEDVICHRKEKIKAGNVTRDFSLRDGIVAAEKVAADIAASEEAAAEKAVGDKAAAENVVAQGVVAEKAVGDKAEAEKAVAEGVAAEKDARNKAPAEKASAEKAEADAAALDKALRETQAALDHAQQLVTSPCLDRPATGDDGQLSSEVADTSLPQNAPEEGYVSIDADYTCRVFLARQQDPSKCSTKESAPSEEVGKTPPEQHSQSDSKAAERSVEELVAASKAKGNEAYKRNQFEEAAESFSEAIALCTNDAGLYANRSAAYYNKEAYAEALEDAQACIRLRPEWPKGYARQGSAQYRLGMFEASIQSYADGLEKDQFCTISDSLKKGLTLAKAAIDKAKQAAERANADRAAAEKAAADQVAAEKAAAERAVWVKVVKAAAEKAAFENDEDLDLQRAIVSSLESGVKATGSCERMTNVNTGFSVGVAQKVEDLTRQMQGDWSTQIGALTTLHELGKEAGDDAVNLICSCLENHNAPVGVKMKALEALETVAEESDERAINAIRRCMEQPCDNILRREAKQALERLEQPSPKAEGKPRDEEEEAALRSRGEEDGPADAAASSQPSAEERSAPANAAHIADAAAASQPSAEDSSAPADAAHERASEAVRAELQSMSMRQLLARAGELGAKEGGLDAMDEADNPKMALIEFIVSKTIAKRSEHVTRSRRRHVTMDGVDEKYRPLKSFVDIPPAGHVPGTKCSKYIRDMAPELPGIKFLDETIHECKQITQSVAGTAAAATIGDMSMVFAIVWYTFDLALIKNEDEYERENNGYFILNSQLRQRQPRFFKAAHGFLFYLMTGLSRLPPASGYVYRGLDGQKAAAVREKCKVGRSLHWSSFSSATRSISTAEEFAEDEGVLLRLQLLDVDSRSRDIQEVSAFDTDEQEILLLPNFRTLVLGWTSGSEFDIVDLIEKAQEDTVIDF